MLKKKIMNDIFSKPHITSSSDETHQLAERFAKYLREGDIVALVGDLGAGKTEFIKGMGKVFGITKIVSPSFTLIRQYTGDVILTHIDLYRLNSLNDCVQLLDEYFDENSITAIEWADKLIDDIPDDAFGVLLEYSDDSERTIRIDRWRKIQKLVRREK